MKHSRPRLAPSATGFTLIELLVVVAILAVVATIALPALLRARVAANETSAIASLRSIHSAQGAYSSICAHGGFAQTLNDLALPPAGSSHGFISATLSSNGIFKSGYIANVAPDLGAIADHGTGVDVQLVEHGSRLRLTSPSCILFRWEQPVSVRSRFPRTGSIFFRSDGVTVTPGMAGANSPSVDRSSSVTRHLGGSPITGPAVLTLIHRDAGMAIERLVIPSRQSTLMRPPCSSAT